MHTPLQQSAAYLLPHRPPMVLVDTLLHSDETGGAVEAHIPPDALFVDSQGRLDPLALLEVMAQGCAMVVGFKAREQGAAIRGGYLVGVRRFEISGTAMAGDTLLIRIDMDKEFAGFALFRTIITRRDVILAQATLKTYLPNADGTP